jgi:hypothetical protein
LGQLGGDSYFLFYGPKQHIPEHRRQRECNPCEHLIRKFLHNKELRKDANPHCDGKELCGDNFNIEGLIFKDNV